MDTRPLEQAKQLIADFIDTAPHTFGCCENCGSPTPQAKTAHKEREMLTAAIARLSRVIDHHRLGTPV